MRFLVPISSLYCYRVVVLWTDWGQDWFERVCSPGKRERGRERERGRDKNKDRDEDKTVWFALRELQSDVVCSWLRNIVTCMLSCFPHWGPILIASFAESWGEALGDLLYTIDYTALSVLDSVYMTQACASSEEITTLQTLHLTHITTSAIVPYWRLPWFSMFCTYPLGIFASEDAKIPPMELDRRLDSMAVSNFTRRTNIG